MDSGAVFVQFVILFFSQKNTDECSQEGVDVEEVEEAMVADEEEEDADEADTVELDERPTAVEADVTPSAAAARPGANIAVANKAVRRLSFSSAGGGGGGNEPKKLKMSSSGKAKDERKVPKKNPVSKTKKAGLVLSVSRVHNRLKENRYANRVRFYIV